MKKLALLAALALMGTAAFAAAPVATVSLNNFDPDRPIFYLTSGTPAPFNKGINVQVWGGAPGSTLAPLKTPTGADTFQILDGAAGYFDAGSVGIVPGVAAGGTGEFQLVAWEGASLASAQNVLKSPTWQQTTKSEDVEPPALPVGTQLNIPQAGTTITVIPEPSTIALGLLGAAALLIRRRK